MGVSSLRASRVAAVPRALKTSTFVLFLCVFFALWVYAYWSELALAFHQWVTVDAYHHSLLVFPLLGYALYDHSSRQAVIASMQRSAHGLWIILLPPVFVVWALGDFTNTNIVTQLAAIALIPTAAAAIWGPAMLVRHWYLFGLPVFLVPFGHEFLPWLQSITADLAVALLKATGYSVLQEGFYIHMSSGVYWVAESCAGLKFLIATVFLGFVYTHYFFEGNARRGAAFFVFAVIVPIPANVLRVYLTVLVGHYFGADAIRGFDHIVYGWILFALIIVLISYIAFKTGSLASATEPAPREELRAVTLAPVPVSVILVILVSTVLFKHAVGDRIYESADMSANISSSAFELSGAHPGHNVPLSALDNVLYSDQDAARISIATFTGTEKDVDLLASINFLFEKTWASHRKEQVQIDSGITAEASVVAFPTGELRLFLTWFQVGDRGHSSRLITMFHQVGSILAGSGRGGVLAVVDVPLDERPEELASMQLTELSGFGPGLAIANQLVSELVPKDEHRL